MENFKINGHKFINFEDNNLNGFCNYKCENCNIEVFEFRSELKLYIKNYLFFNLGPVFSKFYSISDTKLTCEEVIIKQIIE